MRKVEIVLYGFEELNLGVRSKVLLEEVKELHHATDPDTTWLSNEDLTEIYGKQCTLGLQRAGTVFLKDGSRFEPIRPREEELAQAESYVRSIDLSSIGDTRISWSISDCPDDLVKRDKLEEISGYLVGQIEVVLRDARFTTEDGHEISIEEFTTSGERLLTPEVVGVQLYDKGGDDV